MCFLINYGCLVLSLTFVHQSATPFSQWNRRKSWMRLMMRQRSSSWKDPGQGQTLDPYLSCCLSFAMDFLTDFWQVTWLHFRLFRIKLYRNALAASIWLLFSLIFQWTVGCIFSSLGSVSIFIHNIKKAMFQCSAMFFFCNFYHRRCSLKTIFQIDLDRTLYEYSQNWPWIFFFPIKP